MHPLTLLLAVLLGPDLSLSELEAVRFAQNSARLSASAAATLARLAPILRAGSVRLEGHCDRSERRTPALSLERARVVQRFLVGKGVPSERIRIAGYAATRPAAKGEGEETRRQNRRVELVQLGDYD
jgi:outer membrane protein OmpA-like peptidoglycan-associated protein